MAKYIHAAAVCSFRPISTVSLLLSYWLFFERFLLSIFTPTPQSSYSVFKSTEMPLLCLQWHPFFCLPHTNSGCIRRYYHCLSPPFCLLSPLHRVFSPSVFHHRVRLCLLFTLSSLASNGRTVERWLFRKVRETILVDSIRVATNN